MSLDSVNDDTSDWQIWLPVLARPIFWITRMITDRIGLHSDLLPLLILKNEKPS